MRFEVIQIDEIYRVIDTVTKFYITKDITDKSIAQEICDDFNYIDTLVTFLKPN